MYTLLSATTSIKIRIKSGKRFIEDHEYHTEWVGKKEIDIYFNGMYVACVDSFDDAIEYMGSLDNFCRDLKAFKNRNKKV